MSDNLKKTVKPRGAATGTRTTRGRARVSKDAAEGTGKSKGGAGRATPAPTKAKPSSVKTAQRLPRAKRQELVLAKAADYFAEHGLDAQTRAIAEVCGVSQRLLYSLFPSKAALIEEVYNREIAGIFKAIWFVNLKDRSVPLETRLVAFYGDYYETLLTRRWLRLFLYSSLEGLQMARTYSNAVVSHALEIIVAEAAHGARCAVPSNADEVREIGWLLHGAVSHLAIRRRIYESNDAMPAKEVISMTVRAYLSSIPSLLPPLPAA
ncbi:transcriptional regulator, TetR family [Burkholderia sp. YR290]|jgi:AcrR family transcriptional regulator|uniref:TetR/AcrR family transcriptional regulator n=1 Tax=Paraburkholderia hospita TaxID=169430 RepID=UPI00027170A3|nr:TetR/AcrR family transcriptional regulator [Paraburkholderia hospita]EUC13999.1 transcriptional regulator, TetR family [Burkholderia sp. BT03]SKC91336.1 transcriptional regulator, TetR family [Paraburkholderia hospita]SOE69345.1 transcriptional regulator, TetR family [Burkholderia sp. YR290]